MRDFRIATAGLAAAFVYAWLERRSFRRTEQLRRDPAHLMAGFDRPPLVPKAPSEPDAPPHAA